METSVKVLTFLLACLFACTSTAQLLSLGKHPREDEAIEQATAWLDILEQNDAERSYGLFSDQNRLQSETEWEKSLVEERESFGNLVSRDLLRAVVYQDPQNAPIPGLYIAVEFDSVYERAPRHFQYLMLHSQNGEPFKLMRREVTLLSEGP